MHIYLSLSFLLKWIVRSSRSLFKEEKTMTCNINKVRQKLTPQKQNILYKILTATTMDSRG